MPLEISKYESSYLDTQQWKLTYVSLIQYYLFLPQSDVGVQPNKAWIKAWDQNSTQP